MVKQLKTLNVAQGGYTAPVCKVYSITVESVIANSPDGYHSGGGGSYNDDDTNNNGDY